MEQDSNHSGLCKMGCGFYGNHSFEGMCSKCYKDHLKRQQQSSPSAEDQVLEMEHVEVPQTQSQHPLLLYQQQQKYHLYP